MPLGTLDRTPPPFFRQGPSALTKLLLCAALAIFLMVADARFKLATPARAALALVLHPVQRIFAGGGGYAGVEPLYGFAQAKRQHRLPVAGPLGGGTVVGNVRAEMHRIAQLGQPSQGFLFELGFGHCHGCFHILFSIANQLSYCF